MNRLGGCIDSEIIAAVTIVGRNDRPLCNMDDKLTPEALIAQLAKAGREAQQVLGRMDHGAKARALVAAATALRQAETEVLAANAQDLAAGEANGLSPAMLDRLKLDPARWQALPMRSRTSRICPIRLARSSTARSAPMDCGSAGCACRSV